MEQTIKLINKDQARRRRGRVEKSLNMYTHKLGSSITGKDSMEQAIKHMNKDEARRRRGRVG